MAYSKKRIIDEYDASCNLPKEYEKAKWGAESSMVNRMMAVLNIIDFGKIKNWLDVGSGTGLLQDLVCSEYPSIVAVGIDLSPNMIKFAKSEHSNEVYNLEFHNVGFKEFKFNYLFDCITCLGVVQKTDMSIDEFFERAFVMLSDTGILLLNTKNRL